MTELLLATRSRDKALEIAAILASTWRGRVLTLDDAGLAPDPEEEGIEVFETFVENAHAKAAWFLAKAGIPTIADDSGICVDALGGAPGVHSRRFAAESGLDGKQLDHANNMKLLTSLEGVPLARRTAHYTCAAVLHTRDGARRVALGVRAGIILDAPRGSHGFGYDPLFLDATSGLSFGELDPALKNRTSHRSRAFRALAAHLPG